MFECGYTELKKNSQQNASPTASTSNIKVEVQKKNSADSDQTALKRAV